MSVQNYIIVSIILETESKSFSMVRKLLCLTEIGSKVLCFCNEDIQLEPTI